MLKIQTKQDGKNIIKTNLDSFNLIFCSTFPISLIPAKVIRNTLLDFCRCIGGNCACFESQSERIFTHR